MLAAADSGIDFGDPVVGTRMIDGRLK